MTNVAFEYDSRDYRDTQEILITEELTDEDIADGLIPEEIFLKVCLTSHAYNRIYNDFGRQCEWNDVVDLLLEKGHNIFNMKTAEEFAVVRDDKTLALICKLYPYKGHMYLILETIIQKVIIVGNKEVKTVVKAPRSIKQV